MNEINAVFKTGTEGAGSKENAAEIKKAAVNFEALFINQMLKEMRETISKSGLLHGGPGEEIYTSLFDTEISRLMASSGGIGLEKILTRQLSMEFENSPEVKSPVSKGNAADDKSVQEGVLNDKRPLPVKPYSAERKKATEM